MKAKYIGSEAEPGSQETIVFGMRVKCGETIEVPPQFEKKARINPAFEVIEDSEPVASTAAQQDAPKPRKRKEH